ncbi:glycosyltransferase [Alkalihalobacterium bogoriense]|uniref:glycosyltransferase n=1 Tax=Alkalihalobacterium bogoriense TaxID=246272 RepID=UPI00047B9C7D|nr:glycosyltransferase [Alkalihalobacterium bogoriense]
MRKKVLFVIDSLGSGGAEKSLISLLSSFDYSKFDVELLMFVPKGLYLPLLPKEVKVLARPRFMEKFTVPIKKLFFERKMKLGILRLLAAIFYRNPFVELHKSQITWKWFSSEVDNHKNQYDIAIAYSQGMPTYYVAQKVTATKKIAWVNTNYKVANYNKRFDVDFYKHFYNIVAVSELCKEVFVQELPCQKSKVRVIYDIISPSLILEMTNQDKGFSDKTDCIKILTIGRLVHQKGYDMAIKACHLLKENGYQVKWYAIGEGALREKLSKKVKDYKLEESFIFLGTTKNPYSYLKQCDLYVQPSRNEGYGLAIAEARILQKPIVATNFSVVKNQIKNRANGLIVDMDFESLYKGIKELIDNKELCSNIIENLKDESVGTESEILKIEALLTTN